MKKSFLFALLLSVPTLTWAAYGDTFTSKTVEGIDMAFMVLNETSKTCMAGIGQSRENPAVDKATSGKVTVPENANGYTVVSLNSFAFYDCSDITELILPSTLTRIGNQSIIGCHQLTVLKIPASVNTLEKYSIGGNNNLTAFVVDQDNSVFCSRDGLLLSKDKKVLHAYPSGLTGEYTIPSDIVEVANSAFYGCSLSKLTIPSTVKSVSTYLAYNSQNLTSVVWEPAEVPIPTGAFQYCNNLSNFSFPEGIKSIGDQAFMQAGFTELVLPESLQSVGAYAFMSCWKMRRLSFSTELGKIGFRAFSGCYLNEITINFTTDNLFYNNISDETFSTSVFSSATLNVPTGTKNFFNTAEGWKNFENVSEYGPEVTPDIPIRKVTRHTVMEEATGCWCQWCIRGIIGMKKAKEKYGDQFIGIAIHSSDVMDIDSYIDLHPSGYPTCRVDRAEEEYYPDDISHVEDALKLIPTVDVTVTGTWNSDKTKVNVSSVTELLTNAKGFSVAYALVGDHVKGSSNKWYQNNGYSGTNSTDPDYQKYAKLPSTITDIAFDDVMIGSSYNTQGENLASPFTGDFKAGLKKRNTYTLSLPSDQELANAIDKDQVYVVAIVTNADGTIANAAKAKVTIAEPGHEKMNADAIMVIVNYLLGNPPADFNQSDYDVNQDGKVDIADVVTIVKALSGI